LAYFWLILAYFDVDGRSHRGAQTGLSHLYFVQRLDVGGRNG